MLSPKETGSGRGIYPGPILTSALCEAGLISTGGVPAECTVALGFKPTAPDPAKPLCDPSHHYLLTIRKTGNQVTVWKQGAKITDAATATGATCAEWLQNVLTELSGGHHGYYSRLMVAESAEEPTVFHEPSSVVSGLWVPRREAGAALSVHLDFADAADLGRDVSGNDSHWTLTGAVQSDDTPTHNRAVLNPLVPLMTGTLSYGNRRYLSQGTNKQASAPFAMRSGAYYWEARVETATNVLIGLARLALGNQYVGQTANSWGFSQLGRLYTNGSYVTYGSGYAAGDVVGVHYDADLGAAWFSLNGAWIALDGVSTSEQVQAQIKAGDTANAAFTGVTGPVVPAVSANSGGELVMDFGQDGYAFAPPDGALPLCDVFLPEPEVLDADGCHAVAAFQGPTSGGHTVAVGWDAENSDWLLLLRNRSRAEEWLWVDTVRGLDRSLPVETTGAEVVLAAPLTVSGREITIPEELLTAGDEYVVTVLRTGSGFAIVDGISHTTGVHTVFTHSLGATPGMAVVFNRTASAGRYVYHRATGPSGVSWLHGANALAGRAWGTISAAEFNVLADMPSGQCVVYLFTDSEAVSVFDAIGLGSTDGPFIAMDGALRAIPLFKCSSSSSAFHALDTARDPVNPCDRSLDLGLLTAEASSSDIGLFASTGFKVVTASDAWNKSGGILLGVGLTRQTKYRNAF